MLYGLSYWFCFYTSADLAIPKPSGDTGTTHAWARLSPFGHRMALRMEGETSPTQR